MGLTVITAYLQPPEKWSLFGRKRSTLDGGMSSFETSKVLPCEIA